MKNIVFLLGSYYPNYSAVGRCLGNIADEMEKQGYNVTVIAQKTTTKDSGDEWHGNQHILRSLIKDEERDLLCKENIKTGKKIYKIKHKYYQGKRLIKAILGTNSVEKSNVKRYLTSLNNLKEEPDLIIPTCQPFDTVQASVIYKRQHPKCNIIPVLFDLFSDSPSLHRFNWNKKLKLNSNLKLEKEMLINSLKVFHVPSWSPHINKYFSETNKAYEIEHPLILEPSEEKSAGYNSEKINIVYTGVVDNNVRDPQYVLTFFSDKMFSEKEVHFYSLGSAQYKVERAATYSKNIINHGQVPNNIARIAVSGADVLLSIGNKDNSQIPSKIFEYMSQGKPIIHFSQISDDRTINVLQKYPLCYVSIMDNKDIQTEKKAVKDFLDNSFKKRIPFEEVSSIFEEADVKKITDKILKIII